MTDTKFVKEDLIRLRKDLGLTQQQMAAGLDMALRSYQAIEAGESEYRYVHRLAAERVALMIAVDRKDPNLVPEPLQRDAIELVRIGEFTGNPSFIRKPATAKSASSSTQDVDDKFRDSYGIVGELVLIATALDHQLNHILIQVLHLAESPMLEAVIATLDTVRKIEMLKERAKHISQLNWKKPLASYLDKLERVSRWRNIACHTPLIPDAKHGAVFAAAAAAKLLKNLELGEHPTAKKTPIGDLVPQIRLAESALYDGQMILHNFKKMNAERAKRFGS